MDASQRPRATRASKRRRITPTPPLQPSPKPARSVSPDELASHPHTPVILSRQHSTPSLAPQPPPDNQDEPRRPSFSPVSDSSPDELDHTIEAHSFYRADAPYPSHPFPDGTAPSSKAFHNLTIEPSLGLDSPPTPEYSRISTPIGSPPAGSDDAAAVAGAAAAAAAAAQPPPPSLLEPARFANYRCRQVLKGHKRGVAAVRFSKDGGLVASCSADATVRIWDVATGKCLQVLEGHLAGISTLAWSSDNKTIASGSDDKSIWLWNLAAGKPYPHPLIGHHHYIYSLAFSPKGNILVSGSYDEAVILWDVRTRKILRTLPAHSDPVGGVDFIRDGTLLVSCGGDGLIRVWDTATGQCLRTLVHEDTAPVTSVRFSPNGKFVLAWTLDACVRLWNYVDGRCVKTYQGHQNSKFSLSGAFGVYGGDGTRMAQNAFVVSGSEDGRLVWWDVVSKDVLAEAKEHEGVVLGVDTREDGLLVSCGIDKTVRIWEKVPVENGNGEGRGGLLDGSRPEDLPENGDSEGRVAMANGDHSPGLGITIES